MKLKYNFTYTKKQIGSIMYRPLIPALVISLIALSSSTVPLLLIMKLNQGSKVLDFYPTVYFLGTWCVLSAVPFLTFAVYFLFFYYNLSSTSIHWDFNQEIEIVGNELNATLTNGEDQFHETIHINKIKKKKYATYYYESRHLFVAIPSEALPIQEGN